MAAHDYLKKHNVRDVLVKSIETLVRVKPVDPCRALSSLIAAQSDTSSSKVNLKTKLKGVMFATRFAAVLDEKEATVNKEKAAAQKGAALLASIKSKQSDAKGKLLALSAFSDGVDNKTKIKSQLALAKMKRKNAFSRIARAKVLVAKKNKAANKAKSAGIAMMFLAELKDGVEDKEAQLQSELSELQTQNRAKDQVDSKKKLASAKSNWGAMRGVLKASAAFGGKGAPSEVEMEEAKKAVAEAEKEVEATNASVAKLVATRGKLRAISAFKAQSTKSPSLPKAKVLALAKFQLAAEQSKAEESAEDAEEDMYDDADDDNDAEESFAASAATVVYLNKWAKAAKKDSSNIEEEDGEDEQGEELNIMLAEKAKDRKQAAKERFALLKSALDVTRALKAAGAAAEVDEAKTEEEVAALTKEVDSYAVDVEEEEEEKVTLSKWNKVKAMATFVKNTKDAVAESAHEKLAAAEAEQEAKAKSVQEKAAVRSSAIEKLAVPKGKLMALRAFKSTDSGSIEDEVIEAQQDLDEAQAEEDAANEGLKRMNRALGKLAVVRAFGNGAQKATPLKKAKRKMARMGFKLSAVAAFRGKEAEKEKEVKLSFAQISQTKLLAARVKAQMEEEKDEESGWKKVKGLASLKAITAMKADIAALEEEEEEAAEAKTRAAEARKKWAGAKAVTKFLALAKAAPEDNEFDADDEEAAEDEKESAASELKEAEEEEAKYKDTEDKILNARAKLSAVLAFQSTLEQSTSEVSAKSSPWADLKQSVQKLEQDSNGSEARFAVEVERVVSLKKKQEEAEEKASGSFLAVAFLSKLSQSSKKAEDPNKELYYGAKAALQQSSQELEDAKKAQAVSAKANMKWAKLRGARAAVAAFQDGKDANELSAENEKELEQARKDLAASLVKAKEANDAQEKLEVTMASVKFLSTLKVKAAKKKEERAKAAAAKKSWGVLSKTIRATDVLRAKVSELEGKRDVFNQASQEMDY